MAGRARVTEGRLEAAVRAAEEAVEELRGRSGYAASRAMEARVGALESARDSLREARAVRPRMGLDWEEEEEKEEEKREPVSKPAAAKKRRTGGKKKPTKKKKAVKEETRTELAAEDPRRLINEVVGAREEEEEEEEEAEEKEQSPRALIGLVVGAEGSLMDLDSIFSP